MLTLLGFLLPLAVEAQNSIRWTTNYYSITGATLPEIRQSIRSNRPWKDRYDLDGMTEWKVTWQFNVAASAEGCRCSSFATQTTITVLLPRWIVPTNAPNTVREIWRQYATALAQHESGHAAIALEAAAHLKTRLPEVTAADCTTLKTRINDLGRQVIEEHRRRDKEYDERTRHGATQGASLPNRNRRGGEGR